MEQKIEKAKNYYFVEGKTTLADLVSYADASIPGLRQGLVKEELQAVGPIEFIYFGATADVNNVFTLQIAIPVSEKKAVAAPYAIKEAASFLCESLWVEGSLENIGTVYNNAYGQIAAKQIQPSGEIREVYHVYKDYTDAGNRTEIQIGIKA